MVRTLLLSTIAIFAAPVALGQYCPNVPTGFSCTIDEYISSVVVSSVNQSSACGPGYENFSGVATGFTSGGTYPITVTVSQWYDSTDDVTVFVDWNGDSDFADGGESIPLAEGGLLPNGSVQYTGTIFAPAGIVADPRMRVVLDYGPPSACLPALPSGFGNVEDYGAGGQAMVLTWTDLGPATIGFQIAGGQANGSYVLIATFDGSNYPNGWFYGISTTFQEIVSEVNSGFPFVGPLNAVGATSFGPIGGVPSGLTVYGVAFATPSGATTSVTKVSAPATHTVP